MEKVILIVDDASAVADVLRTAILELGKTLSVPGELRVEVARSGQELLDRCATEAPDLIILDVNMPGLDGIESFYRLRERNPDLASRTVFLTGFAGSQEVSERLEQALKEGARGVLLKPVGMADLEKLLDRHLR